MSVSNWKAYRETYQGEAHDSAMMLLRIGVTPAAALSALRANFPPDLNLDLIVSQAVEQYQRERGPHERH